MGEIPSNHGSHRGAARLLTGFVWETMQKSQDTLAQFYMIVVSEEQPHWGMSAPFVDPGVVDPGDVPGIVPGCWEG